MPSLLQKLQQLLNDATEDDNRIDGIAIFNHENFPYMKSTTTGYGKNSVIDDDAFVNAIAEATKETLEKAIKLGAGSPEYLRLVLTEAIWSIFLLSRANGFPGEFLVVFYCSHTPASKALAVHSNNCIKYLYNPDNKVLSQGSTESIKELLSKV